MNQFEQKLIVMQTSTFLEHLYVMAVGLSIACLCAALGFALGRLFFKGEDSGEKEK